MRIEQLHFFTEIAKTGSIRKAADNLFISAPALSSALQNLEKELGFPLFKRQRSGVVLTSYGKRALAISQSILELNDHFSIIASDYNNGPQDKFEGDFSISLTVAANYYLLREILPLFGKMNPKLNFIVIQESSQYVLDDIVNDRSDFGLLFGDVSLMDEINIIPDVVRKLLYHENLFALVHETSPLYQRKSVTIEEIAKYPLALTASNQSDNSIFEALFSKVPNTKILLLANNLDLIVQYIKKNQAIGLSLSTSLSVNYDDIKGIPIQDAPSFPTYAVYKHQTPKIEIIERFIQTIIDFSSF